MQLEKSRFRDIISKQKRGDCMAVDYGKLFDLLEERNMKIIDLEKRTGISSNIAARLKGNHYVSLKTIEKICAALHCSVDDLLSFDSMNATGIDEKLFAHIQNRRYLGNKFRLLDFIGNVVAENCVGVKIFADIFAGTGAVASAFTDKQLIVNDLLYCNHVCHLAWFGSERVHLDNLRGLIDEYNRIECAGKNYMVKNFADTYFSRADCAKIGFVREDIEAKFKRGAINERERAILIASLIYAMDKIANTCGHYDAYRHGASFDRSLIIPMLDVPEKNNSANQCFNEDANELVKHVKADLVYVDPPYNSRQYSDTYHLLENVARWKKPPVFGVAKKMDRSMLKSDYCTRKAADAFKELIESIDARYVLLSYNNMADNGDDRSNARISDECIFQTLNAKGKVKVFSKSYRAFSAGKSARQDNAERLFLCEVST